MEKIKSELASNAINFSKESICLLPCIVTINTKTFPITPRKDAISFTVPSAMLYLSSQTTVAEGEGHSLSIVSHEQLLSGGRS